uniref:NADH dehydrogenase subunit 6 n=1 Tax=Brachyuropus grewingkii TaxID=686699 RepID=A0A0U1YU41_9CRUS|nr:NADH dehydrogenase subunit 6 [Brachyuropus grewingkii]AJF22810.1 NADH dehydrogenase subunit 6 [Brachyuropus grewingkii]
MLMALFTLSTTVSVLFMFSKTPLMMALLIVSQTLTVAVSLYVFLLSSWLSFILFMILVSAMMVIFVYVSSLASNDFLTLPYSLFVSILYFAPTLVLGAYLTLAYSKNLTKTQSTMSDTDLGPTIAYKLYAPYISSFTLFLITYLLVTLVIVAKITLSSKGALRALKP